ncbi:hypothetical protein [Methylopila sp. 73B]|uniref:hypothetical protein n=1 Tax=Methylopila sp. 73B TaxID=1120792 RepID=UPI0012DC77EF|nr:hypothetical protein [Methylopila sp. 73B]
MTDIVDPQSVLDLANELHGQAFTVIAGSPAERAMRRASSMLRRCSGELNRLENQAKALRSSLAAIANGSTDANAREVARSAAGIRRPTDDLQRRVGS